VKFRADEYRIAASKPRWKLYDDAGRRVATGITTQRDADLLAAAPEMLALLEKAGEDLHAEFDGHIRQYPLAVEIDALVDRLKGTAP
jgi:hypothetical protein